MRLSDPDTEVRERNESAWLLPNDGAGPTTSSGWTCSGSPTPTSLTW